jgi:hypothetical protein
VYPVLDVVALHRRPDFAEDAEVRVSQLHICPASNGDASEIIIQGIGIVMKFASPRRRGQVCLLWDGWCKDYLRARFCSAPAAVQARPGWLSGLSVLHSKSEFCGA